MAPNKKIALSVTQLNRYVKGLFEKDEMLSNLYLIGEISNFTRHRTGNLYMSLKDGGGLIKAVMFKNCADALGFKPEDGMQVICRGRVTLYEQQGSYQFYIDAMQPNGAGSLAVAFEQLKKQLQEEGLFSTEHKKPVPAFPKSIAVITSPTGAALQDMLNILKRRFPIAEVIHCPVQVQGDIAAPDLIKALNTVNEHSLADTIIIGRGGGSIEDLWAFNDEHLARAIFASKIPVISAVGHETDFTICDFVADLRAPTPSAAAELAVPDMIELSHTVKALGIRLDNSIRKCIDSRKYRLSLSANNRYLKTPNHFIDNLKQRLDIAERALISAAEAQINAGALRFAKTAAGLDALSPVKTMLRGFSAVSKNGNIIKSCMQTEAGDILDIKFSDGLVSAAVIERTVK